MTTLTSKGFAAYASPPSIRNMNVPEVVPTEYEAFMYRFTHHPTGRQYIGVHKGSVGDGYWNSSQCDEFRELLRSPDPIFDYEIAGFGSWDDMLQMEYRSIKSAKDSGVELFNKSRGQYANQRPNSDLYQWFVDAIERVTNGEVIPGFTFEIRHIDKVYGLVTFQSRQGTLDHDKMRLIRDRIDDKLGNTDMCNPVVILSSRDHNGKIQDVRHNGNHTTNAIYQSKHGVNVPVIVVDPIIHEQFGLADLRTIGNMLNPIPEVITSPAEIQDAVVTMLDHWRESGTPSDDPDLKTSIMSMGFSSGQWSAIKRIVDEEIRRAKAAAKKGANFIKYDGPNDAAIQTKVAKFEDPKYDDTYVRVLSLGSSHWIHNMVHEIMNNWTRSLKTGELVWNSDKPIKDKIVFIVYHPNVDSEAKWKGANKDHFEETVRRMFVDNPSMNIKAYQLIEMPAWSSIDGSEDVWVTH